MRGSIHFILKQIKLWNTDVRLPAARLRTLDGWRTFATKPTSATNQTTMEQPPQASATQTSKFISIEEALQTCYSLNKVQRAALINSNSNEAPARDGIIVKNIVALANAGISKTKLREYWNLVCSEATIYAKVPYLISMQFDDIDDALPLLALSIKQLSSIGHLMRQEASSSLPNGNRIHFISQRLNLPPAIVAQHVARHPFVLTMTFDMLQENLTLLLQYGIAPISILRDPFSLSYDKRTIIERLDLAKSAKRSKLMPWMVRCPKQIFLSLIGQTEADQQALQTNPSTLDYLAERLGISKAEAKTVMDRYKQTYGLHAARMKERLDYLLDDAGYTSKDIAFYPRILCNRLDVSKVRFQELKALGSTKPNLSALCLSNRKFAELKTKRLLQAEQLKETIYKPSS